MYHNLTKVGPKEEKYWDGIAISGDGRYQTAVVNYGNIWQSNDYGVNWEMKLEIKHWKCVTMDDSGKYRAAAEMFGYIWQSNDYGLNWKSNTKTGEKKNWKAVAISGGGKHHIAIQPNGYIWQSNDYGVNWKSNTKVGTGWLSVAINSDGRYQTAVQSGGYIWQSNDYGGTWEKNMKIGSKNWHEVAINGRGDIRVAIEVIEGFIWQSNDYGVNWEEYTEGGKEWWRGIAVSSIGSWRAAFIVDTFIWNWRFTMLNNHYKAIQVQSRSNLAQEVCCPFGTTMGLQEIQAKEEAEKKKQRDLFIQIVTRNRPRLARRICYDNL